jgi:hypothetical protein
MGLAPIVAQKLECATEPVNQIPDLAQTCQTWILLPRCWHVRSAAPSASGRIAMGGRFPGLKPG